MEFNVKTESNSGTGTQYSIYYGELLLHVEYCKRKALSVIEQLRSGQRLEDIVIKSSLKSLQDKLKASEKQVDGLKSVLAYKDNKIDDLELALSKTKISPKLEINRYMVEYEFNRVEATEFYCLVNETRYLGFTRSKELSNYIVTSDLKDTYQNIAGVVEMEKQGREWNFDGGFSRHVFKCVCIELGLRHQGTTARAKRFEPYRALNTAS